MPLILELLFVFKAGMYCNSRDVRRGTAEASRKVTLGLADWQSSLLCQASPLSAFAQAVTDCVGGCIEILNRMLIGLQGHIRTHLVLFSASGLPVEDSH